MGDITIRPYKAGDASYISYLHMRYYERAYGFTGVFEQYLLAALAEFLASPAGGQLWVAVDGDAIIGCIAIVKAGENTAQLRWVLTEPKYQGRGIGTRLMNTAMRFCKEQRYTHVFLWTLQMLEVARQLYTKYGFILTEEKPNTEWTGELLMEERWDLEF